MEQTVFIVEIPLDFILYGRSWVERIYLLGPFPFVFLAQNSHIFIRLAESKWYNV
jgi:hypothetical protein